MFDCDQQITKFQDEIVQLGETQRAEMRKRRDSNRDAVRSGLSKAGKPSPVGFRSQGSYAMRTMIQDTANAYDIDDGVYFDAGDLKGSGGGNMSALDVRKMVRDALPAEKFSTPPQALKNCVRVYYKAGYHVDIPVYRRNAKDDPWSGKKIFDFQLASAEWKQSDPKAVTDWFKAESVSKCVSGGGANGQLVRVVRLSKLFANSRESWKGKVGSGFILSTLIARDCYVGVNGREDVAFRRTLESVRSTLKYSKVVPHPVLANETITHGTSDPKAVQLYEKLTEKLELLAPLDDPDCSFGDAMSAWDKFFGTDWFSGQSDPGGSTKESSAPGNPVKRGSDGRYAKYE